MPTKAQRRKKATSGVKVTASKPVRPPSRGDGRESTESKLEEQYRDLFDNTSDLIQSVAPGGHFLYTNKAWRDVLGYSEKEIAHLKIWDIISPESMDHCMELFKKVIAGENVRDIEAIFVAKDGGQIAVEGNAHCRFVEGKPIGTQGFFRDVTERKRAEKALQASAQQWQTTFDAIKDAVFLLDSKGMILGCNNAAIALVGKPYEKILGGSYWEVVQGSPEPMEGCPLMRMLKSHCRETLTFPINNRWLHATADPVLDKAGNLLGAVYVVVDVTEGKEAEEALRQSEERYRTLFDSKLDGMCVMDETMKVLLVNQAAADIFGFDSIDEALGTNPFDLIPPEERERVLDVIKKDMFERDLRQVNEFRLTNKSGKDIWVSAIGALIEYQGKLAGLISFRDITKRKQIEKSLQFSRFLLDSTDGAMVCVDQEGRFIDVNDAECRATGYSREELLSMTVHDIDPNYSAEVWPEFWKKLKQSGSLIFESQHRSKKGRIIPVEILATYFEYDGKGYHCGFARDITERKRAEETLQDSERKFRKFFENAPAYCYMVSSQGTILDMNMSALEALGYQKEELIGEPVTKIYAPGSREKAKRLFKEWKQTGEIKDEELNIITSKGVERTILLNVDAVRDASGKLLFSVSVQRDITEGKRAEETLQQSEERYRTVLEEMEEGYFETDIQGNFTVINEATCRVLGYPREEIIGANYRAFVIKEYADAVYQVFNQIYQTGMPIRQLAWEVLGKDGNRKLIEASVAPLRDQEGQLIGFRGIGRDVTATRKSEERYQTIIRTAMDGFWLSDMQGHFLDVNEAYCRLIGYSRDELLNMSISDIEAIDKPEDIAKRIRKTKRVGYDRFESRHRRKNGEIVDVEIGVNYLSTDGGRQFVFIRDITGRKRAEEALASEAIRRRILIEQSRDGIVVLDENGKVYESNRRFAEMLGYSPEEVRELNVWDWEFQFPREQVQGMIRSVDEKGDHFETRHRRKDGSTYDVEISSNGAIIAGQKLIFCVCRDITERKQAEEALVKSEERYRSVLEQMEEAYYEVDIAGNFTFVNDATCRQLGYSREELIGMNYRVYTTKDDVQNVYEAFNQVYRTGKPYKGLPVVRIRKGGSWLSTETSAFPLRNERGDIIGFRGIARDVTEYKQAEEALRRSEQNLRDSIESSPLGIRVLDGRWKTLYANQALLNFWGYNSIEELEAVPVKQRYTPEGYAVHVKIVKKRKQGEYIPFNYETSIVRSDGQVRYLSVSTRALLWNGARQVQAVYQDITERKQAEEQVKKLYSLQTAIRYINESLLKVDDERALFEQVCRFLVDVELIKFCWIGSADMENLRVKPVAYAGFEDGYLSSLKMRIGGSPYDRGPVGMAIKTRQPCTVADIENDSKFKPWREAALARGYASSLAVPLVHDTEVIGVLSVYSGSKNAFGYAEIDFMAEAANDIALGIRTLRLRRELQQSLAGLGKALEGTVSALASVAEVRDPYTSGHQQRVARLAVAIATEMGLPQEQIEGLHVAGTLHDVGKLYVPAEILSKPGKLTEVEFNLVKIHSQASYDILKNVEFPWPIAQIVLQHHERLDGSGYPQGLRGEDILLEARILAVSDVVEAMASHRPYRPALGIGQALDEISQKSGILYDSEVVDACFKLFYDKEFKLD